MNYHDTLPMDDWDGKSPEYNNTSQVTTVPNKQKVLTEYQKELIRILNQLPSEGELLRVLESNLPEIRSYLPEPTKLVVQKWFKEIYGKTIHNNLQNLSMI